jgi:hypothetical protein
MMNGKRRVCQRRRSQRGGNVWQAYEIFKSGLIRRGLSAEEYERRLRDYVNKHGL